MMASISYVKGVLPRPPRGAQVLCVMSAVLMVQTLTIYLASDSRIHNPPGLYPQSNLDHACCAALGRVFSRSTSSRQQALQFPSTARSHHGGRVLVTRKASAFTYAQRQSITTIIAVGHVFPHAKFKRVPHFEFGLGQCGFTL